MIGRHVLLLALSLIVTIISFGVWEQAWLTAKSRQSAKNPDLAVLAACLDARAQEAATVNSCTRSRGVCAMLQFQRGGA